MEMDARRMRRLWNQRHIHSTTLLPLHVSSTSHHHHVSNTISCWYCDYKISSLNKPLFHFGRRHVRLLKVWFSIGVGFALSALLGVTLILLWELAKALHLCGGNNKLRNLIRALLFGVPSLPSGFGLSFADTGYICISTIISVVMHEFGHAVAAASEGIQIEYIAFFIAVLFPGALVAFNDESLQIVFTFDCSPCVFCWNLAQCSSCGLALFLLPMFLIPFYTIGNSPMVYFLDGESILDATLSHFTSLGPRKRKIVLRLCLIFGFLASVIAFFQELL